VNAINKTLQVCAVKAPEFQEYKRNLLGDIATVTGGTLISSVNGRDLKSVSIDDLGVCEKIIVTKHDTLIIGGNGSKESIADRISQIKIELENETSEVKKDKLRKRLASLCGGMCVLRIYADNDIEMKELKDRVEDTICSVKASIKDGIVLGGGVTLLKVSEELVPPTELSSGQICGFNIVKNALKSPIRQLAENSGLSSDVIENKVLTCSDGERSGFNFATKEWDDNLFDKVVDPTFVEVSALKNASSVIGLYLTTNVAITTEDNNHTEINK
jgi:chaperonin GroEL